MNKKITYTELYFDPYSHQYDPDPAKGTEHEFTVTTQDAYDSLMSTITNPERGIVNIVPTDLEEPVPVLSDVEILLLAVNELAEKAGIELESLPESSLDHLHSIVDEARDAATVINDRAAKK